MGKRKELSHAEIWDDSALVRSWDEALKEYNLYHSIHARGERVEDVLREAEKEESDLTAEKDSYDASTDNQGDHQHVNGDFVLLEGSSSAPNAQISEDAGVKEAPQESTDNPVPQVPDCSGNMSGNDPTLKNLMMSWYYAGYYSGLYEGQKKMSDAPMQNQDSTE
ncbi:MAG: hypothetical protein M1812_005609 [Candelaria pacifica]|nr:MAG: hypothetical protein M1812_005609 [Candelaria pacifica]